MNQSQRSPSEAQIVESRDLVMGYKVFYYIFDAGGPPALHSGLSRTGFQWWPNEARTSEEALCDDAERNIWAPHEVATGAHGCGFHMYFDLWRALSLRRAWQPYTMGDYRCVVCLVAAWGTVSHYYSGTRSSCMEIVAVHNPGHERYCSGLLAELTGWPYLDAKEIQEYARLYETLLINDELA